MTRHNYMYKRCHNDIHLVCKKNFGKVVIWRSILDEDIQTVNPLNPIAEKDASKFDSHFSKDKKKNPQIIDPLYSPNLSLHAYCVFILFYLFIFF
jgi:hypothetical protein